MKKNELILRIVAPFVIGYLMTAFVKWDVFFWKWDVFSRLVTVTIGVFLVLIINLLALVGDEFKL